MNRQNHPKSLNKSYCRCMFGNLRKTSSMAPFFGGCGSMVFFLSIESMGIPKFYLKRIFCSDNSLDLSDSQRPRCFLRPQAVGRYDWDPFVGANPQHRAWLRRWKLGNGVPSCWIYQTRPWGSGSNVAKNGLNYVLSWGRPAQIGWKLWWYQWYLSTGDLFYTIQSTNMENHLDSSDKLRIPGWIPWCFRVSRVDSQTHKHPSAPAGSHGRCGRRTLESSAQSPPFQNGSVLEKCGTVVFWSRILGTFFVPKENSLDWFKVKFTGNHGFYHQI